MRKSPASSIHSKNLPIIQEALDRITNPLKLLGYTPFALAVQNFSSQNVEVQITAEEEPAIEEWNIRGIMEPQGKSAAATRYCSTFPATSPIPISVMVSSCQHCGQAKSPLYILQSKTTIKEYKVFCRQCIPVYVIAPDEAVAANLDYFHYLIDLEELIIVVANEGIQVVQQPAKYTLRYILAISSAVIKVKGFISLKAAAQTGSTGSSTASYVQWLLSADPIDNPEVDTFKPTNGDYAIAEMIMDWGQNIPADTEVGYMYMVRILCDSAIVTHRNIATAVSMISAYQREIENLERSMDESQSGNHVGSIGDVVYLKVKVVSTKELTTQYGETILHVFEDDKGNTLKWFGKPQDPMNTGDVLNIKAVIKDHKEWKGKKETIVNRVYRSNKSRSVYSAFATSEPLPPFDVHRCTCSTSRHPPCGYCESGEYNPDIFVDEASIPF